jgi:hypothetical protein
MPIPQRQINLFIRPDAFQVLIGGQPDPAGVDQQRFLRVKPESFQVKVLT